MSDVSSSDQQDPNVDGLLFACRLNGHGGAETIAWDRLTEAIDASEPVWVHLDQNSPTVRNWIMEQSGIAPALILAFLADETRPRVTRSRNETVVILRGINTNPEADLEDMVAIRIWCDGQRIISLRHRRLMTPRDILQQLQEFENGPSTVPELFERLIARLTERMAGTIAALDERLDQLEEDIEDLQASEARKQLSKLRKEAVGLRRYIAPQREALHDLNTDFPKWLSDNTRIGLRETTDRLLRYVEELDAARERSLVIKDDIANQMAESTNRTLYVLSIISAIFLPLGFLTGLFGINIGGMPGVENQYAFWIACIVMVIIAAAELWIFKKLGWLSK
jgi:zinc transporter